MNRNFTIVESGNLLKSACGSPRRAGINIPAEAHAQPTGILPTSGPQACKAADAAEGPRAQASPFPSPLH